MEGVRKMWASWMGVLGMGERRDEGVVSLSPLILV
jgi:hypothetical protein